MKPVSAPPTATATTLEGELRRIAREEAAAALHAALQDLPGREPEYSSIAAHARRAGVGASTLRRWATAAGVRRAPNGRYRTADLAAVVAAGGRPPPEAPPPVADIAAERARRAVDSLTGRRR
jgi:hypothetical protein